MKDQMELKLGTQEKSLMRNLTNAINKLAVSMQLYMPQKPKNSEIRLTEPANLEDGGYVAGDMSPEEAEKHLNRLVEKGLLTQEEAEGVEKFAYKIPKDFSEPEWRPAQDTGFTRTTTR